MYVFDAYKDTLVYINRPRKTMTPIKWLHTFTDSLCSRNNDLRILGLVLKPIRYPLRINSLSYKKAGAIKKFPIKVLNSSSCMIWWSDYSSISLLSPIWGSTISLIWRSSLFLLSSRSTSDSLWSNSIYDCEIYDSDSEASPMWCTIFFECFFWS